MITQAQYQFLVDAKVAARQAEHPFPGAAAAEAAFESTWGTSESAKGHNNLLGLKPPSWWQGSIFYKTTKEDLPHPSHAPTSWKSPIWLYTVSRAGVKWDIWQYDSPWCDFPSYETCFETQVRVLQANPVYKLALAATGPEEYILNESSHWATDPARGQQVLLIFNSHKDVLG